MKYILFILFYLLLITACSYSATNISTQPSTTIPSTAVASTSAPSQTLTLPPSPTSTLTPTPTTTQTSTPAPTPTVIPTLPWSQALKVISPDTAAAVSLIDGWGFEQTKYRFGAIAFSPDSTTLALAYTEWKGSTGNPILELWDIESKNKLHELAGHGNVIRHLAFSPDGSMLASGSWDRTVKIWETRDGNLLQSLSHYDQVDSLAFSPDGNYLAAGSTYGYIRTWYTADWSILRTQSLKGWAMSVEFSPDGQELLIGLVNNGIEIYRVDNASLVTQIMRKSCGDCYYQIPSYSKDGSHLIIAFDTHPKDWFDHDTEKGFEVWSLADNAPVKRITGIDANFILGFAFSTDGKIVLPLTESADVISLWNILDGQQILALNVKEILQENLLLTKNDFISIDQISLSPDGRLIATGMYGGALLIWGVQE
jgi:WD40 repeat protein